MIQKIKKLKLKNYRVLELLSRVIFFRSAPSIAWSATSHSTGVLHQKQAAVFPDDGLLRPRLRPIDHLYAPASIPSVVLFSSLRQVALRVLSEVIVTVILLQLCALE